jgi:hypothetical protein
VSTTAENGLAALVAENVQLEQAVALKKAELTSKCQSREQLALLVASCD